MMRRDDPAFKHVVDGVIAKMQRSGAAEKLYNQWFTQPIPPKGVSLNYPLSAEMKELFRIRRIRRSIDSAVAKTAGVRRRFSAPPSGAKRVRP